MNRLAAVTEGFRPPGVYRWLSRAHPESIRRELVAAVWGMYPLDGRAITNATQFLDRCAQALAFPAWFGRNWDALADCLTDLSWLTGLGHVVLWDQYGTLARHDPKAWALAHRVFGLSIEERVRLGSPPLYLLLRGAGPIDSPHGPELIPAL